MKSAINPMYPRQRDPSRLQAAPRCSATSKRSNCRCKAPAVKGWSTCRFHGARGGAPTGEANGSYRHGMATREALSERRNFAELMRGSRAALARVREADQ